MTQRDTDGVTDGVTLAAVAGVFGNRKTNGTKRALRGRSDGTHRGAGGGHVLTENPTGSDAGKYMDACVE